MKTFILNFLFGKTLAAVKDLGEYRLNHFMVMLGRAFGPDNIIHFSELTGQQQTALLYRVPVLRGNHTDWLKPFQWVPRTLNCYVGAPGEMIEGTAPSTKPIPPRGTYFVARGYVAFTFSNGLHVRAGWRWDDIDDYLNLSFSVKMV